MTTFTISATAYAKIKSHALKYPHCEVTGVLLANKESRLVVNDAIPFFHQGTKLLPMTEVAFQHVDKVISNLSKQSSLDRNQIIVGYYEIPATTAENFNISPFAQRIGDRISQVLIAEDEENANEVKNSSGDNKISSSTLILSMHNPSGRLQFFVKTHITNQSGGQTSYSDTANNCKWTLEEVKQEMIDVYNKFETEMMESILRDHIHLEICDFDMWLDDCKENDFMNVEFSKLLSIYAAGN